MHREGIKFNLDKTKPLLFASLAAISLGVGTMKGLRDAGLVEEVSRKFILKMRRGVKNREPQSRKKGAGLLRKETRVPGELVGTAGL